MKLRGAFWHLTLGETPCRPVNPCSFGDLFLLRGGWNRTVRIEALNTTGFEPNMTGTDRDEGIVQAKHDWEQYKDVNVIAI